MSAQPTADDDEELATTAAMRQIFDTRRRGIAVLQADGDPQDAYLRYTGFAQLTGGGSAGGDLGVGVAGALGGLGCDLVAGSAQGRVRPASDQRLVGEARWSLCLSRIGFTAVFEGRNGIAIAPALDARRSLWSRRYDENYRRMTIAIGEGWWPGSGRDRRHGPARDEGPDRLGGDR
jgi:hypothetical protein